MKQFTAKISILILTAVLIASCNSVKQIGENEHLLTENSIFVNNKKNNAETIKNLLYQKRNSKLLGFPLRLYIHNLAKPNLDSILDAKLRDKLSYKSFSEQLYSKKQLIEWNNYKKGFNNWLRNTGEPPAIYDKTKTAKSLERLKAYYINNGWFNAESSFKFQEVDFRKASVDYHVKTGDAYLIDSISRKIASPKIDSIYRKFKDDPFVKKGDQYRTINFELEQDRITSNLRNSGFYHFNQDYVFFEMDTIGTNKKVNVEIQIQDRIIRNEDSVVRKPFNIYTIKAVNIFTDNTYENRNSVLRDSVSFNGYNIYSYDKLRYKPKALTDAVFITPNRIFKDLDRTRTYRHLSDLRTFNYPNIEYIETDSTSLITNIFLKPRKKYSVGFDFDISQSNIQTIGFAFSTSLLARNIFKGAETLEISAIGSIGASKDASDTKDQFFDINEIGADLKLTIPRLFFPFNTERLIPKYMLPSTRISIGATSQKNIGLDKQTVNGILNYKWKPSQRVTDRLDLFNVQFVKNLNIDNYFGVYTNSFDRLNVIARDINYIDEDESLKDSSLSNKFLPADIFIDDVLSNNTVLSPDDDEFVDVNIIEERKQRLTEDNLILSSSFSFVEDKRENLFDNSFSIFRFKLESAGNLFSTASKLLKLEKNNNDKFELFNVAYSQYVKTEIDYIKHWSLGGKNVFAIRNFIGLAVPYGNSTSIPFAKSFFAGGANDNRAWTAYNLGPGRTTSNNEFNEANLKLAFSMEYRYNLFNNFNGAFFVDAGNIWNVLDEVDDPDATFTGLKSLEDTAIGAGFGLRYDFSFFILRFDIGFKAHDPSYVNGNKWFNDFNFNNAVYNVGINYPF
ncbi:MAG: BamA/TamA family outer membrane protein [Flavobacteriaceae bacterium]|nr:BamA/TamA family outer membrane protein [Flavobacteriaceae bacterium]